MNLTIENEKEDDGRWIAEVVELPGVISYGATKKQATAKAQALALRVMAERLEHEEAGPDYHRNLGLHPADRNTSRTRP